MMFDEKKKLMQNDSFKPLMEWTNYYYAYL